MFKLWRDESKKEEKMIFQLHGSIRIEYFYCSNSDCTVWTADSLPLCYSFILESTLVQKLQTNNSNAKIPTQKKFLSDSWRGEKREKRKKLQTRDYSGGCGAVSRLWLWARRAPFLSDTKST